ncbi:hypothetical protein V5799_005989 [Amblyomma americanum]|uniref:Uncharacterized protein n=1 Tax=Amblyomma americanum TaxID=6943 RepID=A0AAQ4DXQ0_AMBAM
MDLFVPRRLETQDLLSSEEFDCYEGFGHGVFQRRLLLLCILAIFVKNCHVYATTLTMGEVDHWCKRPQHWNMSTQEWKNAAIPLEADGQYSRCHQYANPYKSNDTSTVPCTAWEYDEDQAATSMVSHWDLVCDRMFLRVVLVFLNVAGLTTAGIAAGSIADTVGRRPVLMATTASLLASTTVLCLGRTFPVHAVAKFIASGSAAAQFIAAGILYFEVTIHENRPLHVVIAGAVAVVISELWLTVLTHMTIHWALKQAVFLAPTFLSAAAFCVGVESPRWLVAKARFQKAEDVMLAAAETNLFPLYNTACLLDKLKGKAAGSYHPEQRTGAVEMLQGVSIRKRAMAIFFTYFSVYFVLQIVVYYSLRQQSLTLHCISFALVVLSFAGMLYVITRVTLLQFISACFAVLCVLQCMSSLAITTDSPVVKQGLVMSAKALVFVGYIVLATFSLELFPTAVRGTSSGWIYGFGGLGAVMAAVSIMLTMVVREDVCFAVAGTLMFASLLVLRTLPRNTTAECAKIAVKCASVFREQNVERMKKTLEQREGRGSRDSRDSREPIHRIRRSRSSIGSDKSTGSSRRRHVK